jgi:hypothetical protein
MNIDPLAQTILAAAEVCNDFRRSGARREWLLRLLFQHHPNVYCAQPWSGRTRVSQADVQHCPIYVASCYSMPKSI